MPERPQPGPTLAGIIESDMMFKEKRHICPVQLAGSLDNRIRKWLQDPKKILGPYIESGMSVLDIGCGPGFFTVEIADMVGESGKVIAADVQEGMLEKLRDKIKGTAMEHRIQVHKCNENNLGFSGSVDFVIAFYVIHEMPNQQEFFREVKGILKSGGYFLVAEPKLFHVSKNEFDKTIRNALDAGFEHVENLTIRFSRAVILRRVN